MSINSILSYAKTGLFTAQEGLRVTSNNIANVNTPGYSRQVLHQEAIVSGTQQGGVGVQGIERIVDQYLVKSKRSADGSLAYYDVSLKYQEQIQSMLGNPTDNTSLSGRLTDIFSTLSELALDPSSVVLKEAALVSINRFGDEVETIAQGVQDLRLDASNQISETVSRINELTERISELNPLIIKETVTGGAPGALEEQRAQALDELSSLIDISTATTGQGGIQVSTSTGLTLVGVVRYELQYSAPGTVVSGTTFSPITVHKVNLTTGEVGAAARTLDGQLISGELKALLDLRDVELPEISRELSNLGSEFADQLNRVHNSNNSSPATGSMTGVNVGLTTSDAHNFTGKTTFAVTDADGVLINSTTIDFTGIGGSILDVISQVNTNLGGDGVLSITDGVMSFAGGSSTQFVSIVDDEADPSDRAGRGFSHFFGLNNLVETQVATHYDTGVKGTDAHGFTLGDTITMNIANKDGITVDSYTMTVSGTSFNDLLTDLNSSTLGSRMNFSLDSNGKLTATSISGNDTLEIVSDTTVRGTSGLSISEFFGLGSYYEAGGAFNISVRDSYMDDPSSLSLAKLDTTGVVGDVVLSTGDQKGAQALQDLENTVHDFEASGGLGSMSTTLSQYAGALLSDLGLRAGIAEEYQADHLALSTELEQRVSDYSGVNLDEELTNMIIYQNAYSASARLITVAQELYDELLRTI